MGNGNGSGSGGSFGQTVASLLDTYTKCLALLKGVRKSASSISEPQVNLGRSLRSDRARIRHAYSSRLSQDGSRLDKGDGEFDSLFLSEVKRVVMYLKHP